MFACLPYCASWLLTAYASSLIYLYSARFLVGIGHAAVLPSIYTVEVTSTEMRASFTLIETVVKYVSINKGLIYSGFKSGQYPGPNPNMLVLFVSNPVPCF